MKIFTLTLWCFALSLGLAGQKFTRIVGQNWANSKWNDDTRSSLTYNARGLVWTILEEELKAGSGEWIKESFVTIDYYDDGKQKQIVMQTWNNGTWLNESMLSFTYIHGKLEYETFNKWDNSVWTPESRVKSNYDAGMNLISQLHEVWDNDINNWAAFSRTTYTNLPNGKAKEALTQNWDEDLDDWVDSSKDIYTYSGNFLVESLQQLNAGDDWMNFSREIFTYTAQGLERTRTNERWGFFTSNWEKQDSTTTSYNAKGDIVEELEHEWNIQTHKWDINYRTLYFYDVSTSIAGVRSVDVSVFPNPADDNLNLLVKNGGRNTGYSISDLTGRVVLSGIVTNDDSKIDVSKLLPGYYFVRLQHNGNSMVIKFIKR